jgi:hypothetical protein
VGDRSQPEPDVLVVLAHQRAVIASLTVGAQDPQPLRVLTIEAPRDLGVHATVGRELRDRVEGGLGGLRLGDVPFPLAGAAL